MNNTEMVLTFVIFGQQIVLFGLLGLQKSINKNVADSLKLFTNYISEKK